MTDLTDRRGDHRVALRIGLRCFILFLGGLPIMLTAGDALGLQADQTANWILATFGVPGVIAFALSLIFKQPLVTTGNIFAMIFVISLGREFSYPEIVGAFMTTGAVVLVVSLLGLTTRVARWLPAAVVFGLLAGAVMPFVSRIFTLLGAEPLIVGGTFLAYILGAAFLGKRVPPLLPAAAVGLILAGVTGQLSAPTGAGVLPIPQLTVPEFTSTSLLTIVPVLVILITLQSNLPSIVYLKNQGGRPPGRAVDLVSGIGTALGSLLGPTAVSLSLPVMSLVAGDEASGETERYNAAMLASGSLAFIGLLAGFAANVPQMVPESLLLTLTGLAIFPVLTNALLHLMRGPLILGPVFAFAVALSGMSFLGLGPFLWSLVIGTGVSWLLERDKIAEVERQLDETT